MIMLGHLSKLLAAWLLLFSYDKAAAEQPDKVLFQQIVPRVPTHLVAEVILAGRPDLMVLDTGSELTTIDLSLKDSVGPEIEKRNIKIPGVTDRITKCYAGPSLKIGAILDERPEVNMFDLKMLARTAGRPFVGILGMNVMKRGKILLNYDERKFLVHVGPWTLNRGDFHEVELNKETGIPEFNVRLQGHSIAFGVETGYDGCIGLKSSIFDSLVEKGIIEPSKLNDRPVSLGGISSAKRGWFLKGELMGKDLSGVSVGSETNYSRLGLKWLYAFNTEIDSAGLKLRYQLRSDPKRPCWTQLMVGAILSFDEEGAFVEKLRPGGGAAENAGIKPGDVIQEFAAFKGKELNEDTIAETVADEAGKEISIRYLRKSDGTQVSAKLRLPSVISDWDFAGRDIFNGK